MGIGSAGRRRYRSPCGRLRAREAARDGLWDAAVAPAQDGFHPEAEDALVRGLATEILSADAEWASLESDIASRLSGGEDHQCPLAVPGVGAKTAAVLAATVDISLFDGDDSLASHCGLAPSDSRSGTSIGPTSATRAGNRQLKNLLIFSRNSLAGTRNRFGRRYVECRSRSVRHNRALKAVPRKRPGVIYAIMRDRVPYEEPPTAEKA